MLTNISRPLHGIRVLDLTVALSGPYATLILGGLGAEVIRVEAPGGSDISSSNPPSVGKAGINFGPNPEGDLSLTTLSRARNKKSVTLDLKTERGREILMRLAAECDVVVENMSEGTAARLKVDYEHLRQANSRIVYASIKAFGEPSEYPSLKGMDIIVQALSGVMEATGFADGPPTRLGIPVADLLAPMFAVQGILAALIQRGRTGEGQQIQVSMLDCLASWVAEEHFDVLCRDGQPTRTGNSLDRLAPFGVYPTKDGHVAIVAFRPDWMKALLEVVGRPELVDDPRFATRGPRLQHAAELNTVIQAWTQTVTSEHVVDVLLEQRGIPAAKIRTPHEVVQDPSLHESGAVTRLKHPRYGDVAATSMGLPIRFSASVAQFDQPAMELGSSNEEVYGQLLGFSGEEIDALLKQRVI
ncbi:CoA transferase [Cupriavidus sp. DF5525]|uniref:CaiB/BaiF CoA transferase family protein n=1 Tax=Cupriavidus sp. DF5525 TaxID=3160989 RepID=UPI0032E01677